MIALCGTSIQGFEHGVVIGLGMKTESTHKKGDEGFIWNVQLASPGLAKALLLFWFGVAVDIDTEGELRAGRPRVLFEFEVVSGGRFRNYDVHPDGERFVMVQIPVSTQRGQLEIVFNWFEELKRLVPVDN